MSDENTITVTLTVERTEVIRSGEKNNKPWVLYRLIGQAERPDGRLVREEIRSFDAWMAGTYSGVKLEAFHNGSNTLVNWTAKAPKQTPKAKRHGGDGEVAELRERLERLERKVNALIGDPDIIIPEQTGVRP